MPEFFLKKKKKKKRVALELLHLGLGGKKIEITHVQRLALVLSMEKTLFYTTNCECSSLGVSLAKLWKWVPSSVVELASCFCNIKLLVPI